MTVPTVIANHRKEEVETRLKKFYTAVYNAHRLENINGNYMVDADDVRSWFEKNIIEKHLNVAKYYQTLKIKEKRSNGKFYDKEQYRVYCYSDGSCSYYKNYNKGANSSYYTITYDINGPKGPNAQGKDLFVMVFIEGATQQTIDDANKNYGCGSYDTKSFNLYNCRKTDSYMYGSAPCFWLIKNNGFKIPDDYPHKI